MIFPSETNGSRLTDRCQEALSIFLGTLNNGLDKSTVVDHVAQAKSIWLDDEMGNRIE